MRYISVIASVIAVLGMFAVSGMASTAGPTDQLKPTLEKLVDIIQDKDLQGQENKEKRRAIIMDIAKERFDFREMSKRVLGATWRDLSESEKDEFVRQMTKLLENNYIGQLENYSGQTVEYLGERIRQERAQVSTTINDKGTTYPVFYIMTKEGEEWMVYDVVIEGVSLIRNYRAQFRSILRREKFAGLLRTIQEKNASFQ